MTDFQIKEYTPTAAAIAILREKYSGPFDVTFAKGMSAAREARAEVRGYRVALEKMRVELKAPALERTRLIDAEAKRITAELLAIEDPIDTAIKAEETRKAEERAAKERAEAARVAAIAARISAIRNRVAQVVHQPAEAIRAALDQAQTLELSEAEFGEFMQGAVEALAETRQALQAALENRIAQEAEEARIKAEREADAARLKAEWEELERLRAAEAARQAEQARIEAEVKAKADAEAAVIRQAQEAEAARIAAAQRELDERRRQIEEEEARQAAKLETIARDENPKNHKARRITKDPLEELAQAVSAGLPIGSALKMAYDTGYEDGLKAAQHAA